MGRDARPLWRRTPCQIASVGAAPRNGATGAQRNVTVRATVAQGPSPGPLFAVAWRTRTHHIRKAAAPALTKGRSSGDSLSMALSAIAAAKRNARIRNIFVKPLNNEPCMAFGRAELSALPVLVVRQRTAQGASGLHPIE